MPPKVAIRETGSDGERHQREVIQPVAEPVHHGKSADQAERQGNGRDESRAGVAQEQEDHAHHEHHGE
jgi:hypothetical protein